jgi:hypothetical protein
LNGLVRSSDWSGGGRKVASWHREDDQTWSFRGSKSRNKVSVGEPAEGSLSYLRHDIYSLNIMHTSHTAQRRLLSCSHEAASCKNSNPYTLSLYGRVPIGKQASSSSLATAALVWRKDYLGRLVDSNNARASWINYSSSYIYRIYYYVVHSCLLRV